MTGSAPFSFRTPTWSVRSKRDYWRPIDALFSPSDSILGSPSAQKAELVFSPYVAISEELVVISIHPIGVLHDHQTTIACEIKARPTSCTEAGKHGPGNPIDKAKFCATAAAASHEKRKPIGEVRRGSVIVSKVTNTSGCFANVGNSRIGVVIDLREFCRIVAGLWQLCRTRAKHDEKYEIACVHLSSPRGRISPAMSGGRKWKYIQPFRCAVALG